MTLPTLYPSKGFTVRTGAADPQYNVVKGRVGWALENLMQAGSNGVTPIACPGLRRSDYAFILHKAGVDIETIHGSHDRPYPGPDALCVLHPSVMLGRKGGVS